MSEAVIALGTNLGNRIENINNAVRSIAKLSGVKYIAQPGGSIRDDLVIDACGMNSPVRRNLPEYLGVEKEAGRDDKISIFRAFYNKASEEEVEAKFRVMLFAGGKKDF